MVKGIRSFTDKLTKKSESQKKRIRIIRTVKDPGTGGVRFLDNMADLPADGNIGELLKKLSKEDA